MWYGLCSLLKAVRLPIIVNFCVILVSCGELSHWQSYYIFFFIIMVFWIYTTCIVCYESNMRFWVKSVTINLTAFAPWNMFGCLTVFCMTKEVLCFPHRVLYYQLCCAIWKLTWALGVLFNILSFLSSRRAWKRH